MQATPDTTENNEKERDCWERVIHYSASDHKRIEEQEKMKHSKEEV